MLDKHCRLVWKDSRENRRGFRTKSGSPGHCWIWIKRTGKQYFWYSGDAVYCLCYGCFMLYICNDYHAVASASLGRGSTLQQLVQLQPVWIYFYTAFWIRGILAEQKMPDRFSIYLSYQLYLAGFNGDSSESTLLYSKQTSC